MVDMIATAAPNRSPCPIVGRPVSMPLRYSQVSPKPISRCAASMYGMYCWASTGLRMMPVATSAS